MGKNRFVALIVLDGWGLNPRDDHNAVALAQTPTMDRIWSACPHTTLITSGRHVGLPEGLMGNSEVGHLNLGAGRVVMQALTRIDDWVNDGSLLNNGALIAGDGPSRRNGPGAAPCGPGLRWWRARLAEPLCGVAQHGRGPGAATHAGQRTRPAGRARHPAQERVCAYARPPGHDPTGGCGPGRHHLWALLCDGSGYTLGPHPDCLRLFYPWRGHARTAPVASRRKRLCAWEKQTNSSNRSSWSTPGEDP